MPGWILVANRFSLLPIIRKRGLLSVIAPLACLVVVSGCSNIRQNSVGLPLPILPSENATATETSDEASALHLLTASGSAESVSTEEGSTQNTSAFDQAAFKNDFAASEFEQSPSVQNFLPSENDFQQQQPHARFLGLLDKADMTDIKLTAVTDKAAPAPAIIKASHVIDSESCETPEACDATAQCACCKKKELPKFAVVQPIDPEQLPELFNSSQNTPATETLAPLQSTLRPLQATIVAAEPIRLTARQDSQVLETPKRPEAAQTGNKAHQLIPIAPAALQAVKTDLDQSHEAPVTTASHVIKVSPVMDIESALAKTSSVAATHSTPASTGTLSLTPAKEASAATVEAAPAKVSRSGIRVSAIPFQSLTVPLPKPVTAPSEAVANSKVEPTESTKYFVSSKQGPNVSPNDFAPNDFTPNDFTPNDFAPNDFAPNEFDVSASSADIDPLAAAHSPAELDILPNMSQIEKELAEFEKSNTFDPSTVIQSDTIDPTILLAKLDGPPKSIAAPTPVPVPAVKIVEAAPNNDLITKQLAAQSSALLELQDAIEQLKPKPVTVSPVAPKLTLNNAAFCTKISGFGQFKPFAENNFSDSQKTLLYCEVENQTAKQFTNIDGSKQFETVLHGSIVIYDANDQIVQTAKFPAIKDVARHQRRDFYVYFPVQFNQLARGDYRLELSVEDAAASRTTVLQPFMKFSVR